MGILAKMKNIFKGNDNPKDVNEEVSKAVEQEQVTVSLGHLVSGLDKTALALTKSSIDDERKSKYAQMLIDMKREISGISEAKTIPALPEAMSRLFSEALPKAFEYGSAESVEDVKKMAFESIRVLLGTKKEQQTATLNLDIQLMNCEIIEGEYWLSVRIAESDEIYRKMVEDRSDKTVKASFERIERLIDNLENRNDQTRKLIERMIASKRDIESDALGTDFLSVHDSIESFLKTLPSIEKQIESVAKIKEVGDHALAKLESDANLLAQALGSKSDEELSERVTERRKKREAAGECERSEAAENETADAQMVASEE